MSGPALLNGIFERAGDVVLPDDFGKLLRPVFTRQDLITHEGERLIIRESGAGIGLDDTCCFQILIQVIFSAISANSQRTPRLRCLPLDEREPNLKTRRTLRKAAEAAKGLELWGVHILFSVLA